MPFLLASAVVGSFNIFEHKVEDLNRQQMAVTVMITSFGSR